MRASSADDPVALRAAGRDLLSLALIEARNHTLAWLAAFNGQPAALALAAGLAPPGAAGELHQRLADTLEALLEQLHAAPETPEGLQPFHQALRREDRTTEALAALALAALPEATCAGLLPTPATPLARPPLVLPAQRVRLGGTTAGWVPGNETGWCEERLEEFEIDAQPVGWVQFAEFANDGGYDRAELWAPAGWAWAQAQGRRAPRGVEQLAGGVLAQRHGRIQRLGAQQPVGGASFHEAQAFARWAGRRLPTEAEWWAAAGQATRRGFAWGQVREWVLGPAALWPGHRGDAHAPAAGWRVLRGASFATPPRQAHPAARRFADPGQDELLVGFRTCAL